MVDGDANGRHAENRHHAVWRARRGAGLRGRVTAPGDKSISHRALILGGLARGATDITGLLESDDVHRTAAAMAALGVKVERSAPGGWRVLGGGDLAEPSSVLDCGNSGTTARLLMGAVAGFPLTAVFTGDASLGGRPMMRVLTPLGDMGVRWLCREGGRLPATVHGGGLAGIDFTPPRASAQVKTAVLLAGLNARGSTRIVEPVPTRDHTERMLRAFGAAVDVLDTAAGREVRVEGGQRLTGQLVEVPGDPSSAAFPLVAALISPGSTVTVTGVLLNPLRNGLLETLAEMGADIVVTDRRGRGGEEIGDVHARSCRLTGVEVRASRVVAMIDELPILAIAAAFAHGATTVHGAAELRVKESDRIAAITRLLNAAGAATQEHADGFTVAGRRPGEAPPAGGVRVNAAGDHRIAMSALVMGLATRAPVEIDDGAMIATSFPGFASTMRHLGAEIEIAGSNAGAA